MPNEIFVIRSMADALRNTGYKNIESAMAEIVDNSIQAEAKNVFIVVKETVNPNSGRKNVSEVVFIDNGTGMTDSELGGCLAYGYSSRTDRRGMGRFGVGLPQASMHACPAVDVYSWQNGYENCKKVFLDVEKVREGEQKNIQDPVLESVPREYERYLEYTISSTKEKVSFKSHGTVVIWKNCDKVVPKTVGTLFDKLLFTLGQKFRYFILEECCSIVLIEHDNTSNLKKIMPNDPLMLMPNNLVLGNPEKPGTIDTSHVNKKYCVPVFEPYHKPDTKNFDESTNSIKYPVKYIDVKTGEVKESFVYIKFSIVKDVFYAQDAVVTDPGSTEIGKHVKKLEGISVVRANREIDFGQFDFYDNVNEPTHRWWGCEIRFNPELDEAFGVANNKQHVELHYLDPDDYKGKDNEVKPMWLQLYSIIHNTIRAMFDKNKVTRKNSRVKPSTNPPASPTETIINNVEQNNDNDSQSKQAAETKPLEERIEGAKQVLEENGVSNPTDEEIRSYLNNSVNICHKAMRNAPLFDMSYELGTCSVYINMDHPFYKNYLEKPLQEDPDFLTAFELFIASLAKVIDETNVSYKDSNDDLIARWNERLRAYIFEQMHSNLTGK